MEIKCAVENCAFNNNLNCAARIVEVNCDDTTMLAANTEETCCGTFAPRENDETHREEVDDIDVKCSVANCIFFKSLRCFAISIEVSSDDGSGMASNREETCCITFTPWELNNENGDKLGDYSGAE